MGGFGRTFCVFKFWPDQSPSAGPLTFISAYEPRAPRMCGARDRQFHIQAPRNAHVRGQRPTIPHASPAQCATAGPESDISAYEPHPICICGARERHICIQAPRNAHLRGQRETYLHTSPAQCACAGPETANSASQPRLTLCIGSKDIQALNKSRIMRQEASFIISE